MTDFALLTREDTVARITLNCPNKHNALNHDLLQSLCERLTFCEQTAEIQCIELTAVGPSFCAGADLNQINDLEPLAHCLKALYAFKKPVVACVQGNVYGGGLGLLACCDLVIAAETVRFRFPEVTLGLSPLIISPYVSKRMHSATLQRFFLTGEFFDALQAKEAGLVHEVVPKNALEFTTKQLSRTLASHPSEAIEKTKHLLRTLSS